MAHDLFQQCIQTVSNFWFQQINNGTFVLAPLENVVVVVVMVEVKPFTGSTVRPSFLPSFFVFPFTFTLPHSCPFIHFIFLMLPYTIIVRDQTPFQVDSIFPTLVRQTTTRLDRTHSTRLYSVQQHHRQTLRERKPFQFLRLETVNHQKSNQQHLFHFLNCLFLIKLTRHQQFPSSHLVPMFSNQIKIRSVDTSTCLIVLVSNDSNQNSY